MPVKVTVPVLLLITVSGPAPVIGFVANVSLAAPDASVMVAPPFSVSPVFSVSPGEPAAVLLSLIEPPLYSTIGLLPILLIV
jgi:hypothetical protein